MKKKKREEMVPRSFNLNNDNLVIKVINHLIKSGHYFAIYSHPNSTDIELIFETSSSVSEYFVVHTFEGKEVKIIADVHLKNNAIEEALSVTEKKDKTTPKIDQLYIADEASFKAYVSDIVRACSEGKLDKVVAAGRKEISKPKDFDLAQTFVKLLKTYPTAFVHLSYSDFGLWMGATPEVLIKEEEGTFTTMSLAGTRRTIENRPWTNKEREEQQIVTDNILSQLKENGCNNIEASGVISQAAGHIEHLRSTITFGSKEDITAIAAILHPTPAVGGFPRALALPFIDKYEKGSRSCYAGFIGPVTKGNKSLYVNLRCMQILANTLRLYIGAGITKDSDPEAEFQEIEAKAQTLLNVL